MRVRFVFQALAVIFAMGVFSANYANAAYVAVVPQVPVVSGAANLMRITGGVVSAGYVFTTGVLQLGAYNLGQIAMPMAFRIAAGAAVAGTATAALAPLIVGGVVLGAAAPYVIDWIQRAHASNVAMDLYYDSLTDTVIRRPSHGFDSAFGDVNTNGINIDASVDSRTGASVRDTVLSRTSNITSYCGRAPYTIISVASPNYAGAGCYHSLSVNYCIRDGGTGGFPVCLGGTAPVMGGTNVSGPPLTASDVQALENIPVNPAILPALGQPVPVDPVPVMNPPTSPNQDTPIGPGVPAAPTLPSQPLRIADGEPIPIPGTNPQQYQQPWQEIVAAPTPTDPYRVDVRPITTVVDTPTAPTVPVTVPAPTTGNPAPGTSTLTDCDKYPGSLGCLPVGTPPPDAAIPTRTLDITQQTGPTFGGGGCPASLNFSLNGQQITGINMATPCSWITSYVKPIILLLAAISAVFIVLPRAET